MLDAAQFAAWFSVVDQIDAWTRRTPDATALEFEGARLSYAQLHARAEQIAAALADRGVGRETVVAIVLDIGFDRVAAVLGVLKSGGAYLPLDPSLPPARLTALVDETKPTLVLTSRAIGDAFGFDSARSLLVDDLPASPREPRGLAPTILPRDLAYVITTSGSTGRPKGVELEHGGLAHMAACHRREFEVGAGSRVLAFFSFSFDAAASEIFTTLPSGATLCLAPRERLAPGRELVETLAELAITHVLLPPSALAVMPDARLPKLTTLISGGERCSASIVRRWAPGRTFINAYGPTETTVTATFWRCSANDAGDPPIGRVRDGNTAHVLNEQMQPVASGEAGELFLGGAGLARGYRHRPELTHARFVADPFDPAPESRLYRTGDRVRQRGDGALEFLGRVDRQVKVRGHRIELEEIEGFLRRQAGVADAAVLFDEHATVGGQLTAYCVFGGDPSTDVDALRRQALAQLPAAMVPARLVALDRLPVTDRGKTDYRALAAMAAAAPGTKSPPAANGRRLSATETTLAGIWANLLGVPHVGADDHFIELGGDSLVSVQIALAAETAGLNFKSADVFAAPTVAKLARLIDERRASAR